jgi:hypothetical protein
MAFYAAENGNTILFNDKLIFLKLLNGWNNIRK